MVTRRTAAVAKIATLDDSPLELVNTHVIYVKLVNIQVAKVAAFVLIVLQDLLVWIARNVVLENFVAIQIQWVRAYPVAQASTNIKSNKLLVFHVYQVGL